MLSCHLVTWLKVTFLTHVISNMQFVSSVIGSLANFWWLFVVKTFRKLYVAEWLVSCTLKSDICDSWRYLWVVPSVTQPVTVVSHKAIVCLSDLNWLVTWTWVPDFIVLMPNSTTRTLSTDMLHNTTNGQAHNNSTTCCTTNLPHRNARAQHLDMSIRWDVANFCPLVVNLLFNKL